MKWSSWFKRSQWEAHMRDEFQFHLDTEIASLMAQGLSREQAELRARRNFGALELAKDECRDGRALQLLDHLWRDLTYALRSLRNSPVYTATAILTLALGIGANTAIFSALNGVVLKPFPYRDPDRLVIVALYNSTLRHATYTSYADFLDWQRESHAFTHIAAFKPLGFDLSNPGAPEHIEAYQVSSDFIDTLGVPLAAGKPFSAESDKPGGLPVALISKRLWQQRFANDPGAIGKMVVLNGSGFVVRGVLPASFRFENQPVDVLTPIGSGEKLYLYDRTNHDTLCVARLAPGVTLPQARAEMNTLQERIDQLNPTTEKGLGTYIVTFKQEFVGDISGTLVLLLGAVGFVLLIACANVANLLLARSAARSREFVVRRALGASRMQIVRQLITESVLLSFAGGLLGLGVAKMGLAAVLAAAPATLPRTENIGLDGPVLVFTLVVSTVVGFVFGLLPALKYSNTDLQSGLRKGGRGSTASHQRTQRTLAVVQIALAMVLLSGAGLLFRSIQKLWAVDPGYDTQHVITFRVGLSPSTAKTGTVARVTYQQLLDRIRNIPGVQAADLTALVPLGRGDNSGPFWIGPHQPASMAQIPRATYYPIGPDYPRTMQIPLLRGRFLTPSATPREQPEILIDTLMEHTYFPHGDALGRTLTIPHWGHRWAVAARIVGVVGHIEQHGLDGAAGEQPQLYFSFYDLPDETLLFFRNEITFAVRTSAEPAAVLPAIRNAVYEADNNQPVYDVQTMHDLVAHSMGPQRFSMLLLVAFAVIALLLATVGVYGVISYSTAQRVPEIGVRMALGAAKWDVVRMLMGNGLRLALVGVASGAIAAAVLTRVLKSFSHLLYGVHVTDPLTFAVVTLALISAAICACYLPARRAARLDPMKALRHD